MRRPALAEDLVPLGEFQANPAEWLRRQAATGRPLVLTRQGRAAAIVVSPGVLDEIEHQRELVAIVLKGLEQVASGDLVDDDDVWAAVEQEIAEAEARREDPVDEAGPSADR